MICIYITVESFHSADNLKMTYYHFAVVFLQSVHAPQQKPSAPGPGSQRRSGMKNRWHSELSSLSHVFDIFTPRRLWSHLFKHLKNTLLSSARERRERLDQKTPQICCRVNAAPEAERFVWGSTVSQQRVWYRGPEATVIFPQSQSANMIYCLGIWPAGLTFGLLEELINFLLFSL